MIRKYFNRILVWTLLIVALSGLTYYNERLFVKPLEEKVEALRVEEKKVKNDITWLTSQITLYNSLFFENNKIEQLIPTGYSQIEIENKYVKRPVLISTVNGNLVSSSITNNVKPENLGLSNNIVGTKINATVEFKELTAADFEDSVSPDLEIPIRVENYVNELYSTARSIYISNINFKLPSEGSDYSKFTYVIEIEYYVFHYLEEETN